MKEWHLKWKPSWYQFTGESGADNVELWELQWMWVSREVSSWVFMVSCSQMFVRKIETKQSQCICCTVLMAGTTSQVFSDVFFFFLLLFISVQLLTLRSRFCDVPVLHPRHRTTPYKGPYDELMISPEITSLWGCWKCSSLFIALPNAYQLRGGAAPEHPSCLVLLDGGPSIFFFFSRCTEIQIITQAL